MSNKNIKEMLLKAARDQKINDNSKAIISNVDTSKVIISQKKAPRRLRFAPYALVGIASAVIMVGIGFAIGSTATSVNTVDSPAGQFDDFETMTQFITGSQAVEYYNIVNVASILDDFTYDVVTRSTTSKNMTTEEEASLVNDVDLYMYNLEEMLGLTTPSQPVLIENGNNYHNYKNDVCVKLSNDNYHIYFDEEILKEENKGETNYKLKSIITGSILVENNEYQFTGTRDIKNGASIYSTKIYLDSEDSSDYFLINEEFNTNENEFTYEAYIDDVRVKYIDVEQSLNTDGSTDSVYLRKLLDPSKDVESNNMNQVTFALSDTHYMAGKLKSRNGDYIYVDKNESSYEYSFKNSLNKYIKEI